MTEEFVYVPVLKWKAGEYKALNSLAEKVKDKILPLIQIPPPGYDFKRKAMKKTLDQQMEAVASDLKESWGDRPAFIDFNLLPSFSETMGSGLLPISYVFEMLGGAETRLIPVTTLSRPTQYQLAVKSVIQKYRKELCIRLSIEEAYKTDISSQIMNLLSSLGAVVSNCSIVIDLSAPESFTPVASFARGLDLFIRRISSAGTWKRIIVCASSFPKTMAQVKSPQEVLPRYEWSLFKELQRTNPTQSLTPLLFGDYGIVHPQQSEPIDPRTINQSAALKYTIDDSWLVFKGRGLKKMKNGKKEAKEETLPFSVGYAQYFGLCRALVASSCFMGKDYSAGDKKIHDTANLTEAETKGWTKKSGTPTIWIEAGTCHHITKVIADLSILGVS